MVAMVAIHFFIGFLTCYGFMILVFYRSVLGIVLLALLAFGVECGAQSLVYKAAFNILPFNNVNCLMGLLILNPAIALHFACRGV